MTNRQRIHTIRLKGPWEYRWLDQPSNALDEPVVAEGTIHAPVSWQECFGSRTGRVSWSRRFQRPTNLDPDERVLLSLEGIRGIERVCLNDSDLQPVPFPNIEARYDLTNGLLATNLMQIETRQTADDDPNHSGLWCPIALEIWKIEAQ